ncbi:hypothetical protein ALC60_07669 [Trachymyrmex zeteki]|uniref:Uncharacterized protein n=1 Tax=Mycetomoellerius zeteki TaxID=64791 RepID=A0A151WYI5_9HYME|nr:hypothetical protein ALC60_07669 [Trachymyrmex zeteki]
MRQTMQLTQMARPPGAALKRKEESNLNPQMHMPVLIACAHCISSFMIKLETQWAQAISTGIWGISSLLYPRALIGRLVIPCSLCLLPVPIVCFQLYNIFSRSDATNGSDLARLALHAGGRGIGLLAESVSPEVHPGSHPAPLRSLFRERYGISRLDPCSASGAGVEGGYDRDVKPFRIPPSLPKDEKIAVMLQKSFFASYFSFLFLIRVTASGRSVTRRRHRPDRCDGEMHHHKYDECLSVFPTSNDNCSLESKESFVNPEVKSRSSKCHGAHCS